MLTQIELHDLFKSLGTPSAGMRLVQKARKEAPVREVQSHRGNVITRYASQKMGRAIAAESRTVEFPAIVQYEHDPKILEYYPQPVKLDLMLTERGTKKPFRLQHTPDFLLITTDGFRLEEWREEERLIGLARKTPGRYLRTDDGWRFPEAEEYLASLGIDYRLHSADEHPQQYVQNLIFLGDYLTPGWPPVEQKAIATLKGFFEGQAVIPLVHLIARIGTKVNEGISGVAVGDMGSVEIDVPKVTTDDIYKAIADGQLTVDLVNDDLGETDRVLIYRDLAAMQFHRRIEEAAMAECLETRVASIEVGAKLTYEGLPYEISLIGDTKVLLKGEQGTSEVDISVLETLHAEGKLELQASQHPGLTICDTLNAVSPNAIESALQRGGWLQMAAVDPNSVPRSKRSLERYRKAMREAGGSVAEQHLSLATKYERCGNHARKIPQELLDLIAKVAQEQFNNPKNITKKAAYLYLLDGCQEAGVRPCSLRTFHKELENLKSIRARKGKRWAYQTDPIVWYLHLNESIHGVRPFQYVHIDHTELDLLMCGPGGKNSLGKVWLTLAVDAESRAVLSFYLSFEAPSYRSCMMVLRDLVRRHGRMPEMLVLDNGKDFKSRAMQRVCQLYGCSIRYRPAGQSRHGSVMERLFGTVNTQFIHLLEGNTQLMKHARMTTKSVLPENFVTWTLTALHGAMDFFCKRIYGTEIHPAHGEAPLEHLERRLTETGERRNRLVRYDDTFRIETCPSPQEGDTRVVDGQRGVKITHIWYWNDVLRKPGVAGQPVEVRVDPWDVRVVYVLVGNQWHRCVSKLMGTIRNRTEIELRYAFAELAKKSRIQKKELSPERLAEHLRLLDAKAWDPRLGEQQAEAKTLYGPLGMTLATSDVQATRCEGKDEALGTKQLGQSKARKAQRETATSTATASRTLPAAVKPANPFGVLKTTRQVPNETLLKERDDDYEFF
ncbi:MAG: DDE-type integrase/transposase/recombinase [Holophagaceae bacterium]|nr:DDE-type integrase/transposase/recombinase [Holophagaceae bacterium]